MKNFTILFLCIFFANSLWAGEPVNLITNGNFESDVTTFTTYTDKNFNELYRIGGERNMETVEPINPTSNEEAIIDGQWYKVANNTGYIRSMIFTEDNNSFLVMGVNPKSAYGKVQITQRIGALDPTKTYALSFKAHLDHLYNTTAENKLDTVLVYITNLAQEINPDEGIYVNDTKLSQKIGLKDEWTNYSLDFDMSTWKERVKNKYDMNPTSVSINFYFEAPLENNSKTFYNAMALDDVSFVEKAETAIQKCESNIISIHSLNRAICVDNSRRGEFISVFNIYGQFVTSTQAVTPSTQISLEPGIYCVKVGNITQKVQVL